MHSKIFSVRTLIAVLLGIFALAPLLIFTFINTPDQSRIPIPIKTAIATPKPQQINVSLPVRLKIPQIKVDAAIEYLGLTDNGEMATTKDPGTVAWYEQGQRPGEVGSAVIAGHFGWKNNLPASFDHLNKLQKGDSIYIVDDKGATISFKVRMLRIFSKTDDAKTVFSSVDGIAHLNLITCEGVWDNASHSYSGRLVAFSDEQ